MTIWTMLVGKGEAREKAFGAPKRDSSRLGTLPSGPPSLEQLESRLLLDVNLTDSEISLSLDAVSDLPAIVVDLNQEGGQVPTSQPTVLPVSDSSAVSQPADASEAILSLALPAGDPEITSAMPDKAAESNVQVAEQTGITVDASAVNSSVNGSESISVLPSGTEEPVVGQESSQTLPRGPPGATSFSAEVLLYDSGSSASNDAGANAVPLGEQSDALLVSKEALLVPREELAQPLSSPPVGAAPYGATFLDTSEYMIGDVWVTLVLLESNGTIDPSTENWTRTEINNVIREVQEGLTWWQNTFLAIMPASPCHLTFHLDTTYADNPVPTSYEPIIHLSRGMEDRLWVNDFLSYVGYNSSAGYLTDMYQWDHDQRIAHNTEWAYTVFVVDSSADADGRFPDGLFALVYEGGPFLYMTYDNGPWGIDNMGEILAHETGHIFYALDESANTSTYTDHSGYYNTQNLNAYTDNPDPGSRVISLMASNPEDWALMDAAYANHTSSPTSLEMIGWQDSDSNGIPDMLDVPLTLDGTAAYSAGQWQFTGTSAVQTLANLNPLSLGHDISTNTVDLVQYRVNGGSWVDGNRYGGYNVNISQNITAASTATVELRTICEETGVSSPIIYLGGPEVTVLGNGVSIIDGDTTASTADGTDFGLVPQGGAPVGRTFTVRNDGTAALTLGSVTVPDGFTLTEGLSQSLGVGASDTFTVQLNTTTIGTKTGAISFPTNDSDENPFTFTIAGTVTASGTPQVSVAVAPSGVFEDGTTNLVYTFTRSVVSSSALTVNFSVAGTATYSTDYTQTGAASFSATAGTIIIPANQTTAQVTVDPAADTTVEPDETVLLTVAAGTGYTVGTPAAAIGTIQNDDGQVNLALGKTAVASSIEDSSTPASNATDGSLYTRWSSLRTDNQWIYVDLGSVATINRIILRWEPAYGRSYQLQVSNDASTWSAVYSTTTGDGGVDDITLSAPASGRYVRMLGIQRATIWGYSLYEFEIYGSPVGTAPEITVLGSGVSITDGDTTPSTADGTDFGAVVQGGTPVSHTFTVRNDGTATLTLGAVVVPTGFTLTEGLSTSLAAGASDTFTVRLDTATVGTKTGQISFTNNDSDENPFNFTITGTVTASAVAEVTVLGNGVSITDSDTTPSTADGTDFGAVVQGGTPVSHTFTVRNDGTATLTLGAVAVPTGFTLTEGLSTSLAAGASDTFTVRLDTATTGTKTGEISFTNNDSDENPFNFTITGTVTTTSENLALGKPAVASSIEDSTLAASNATDGSLYTRWSSLPRSDPQWIYVDLGSVATINRIVLRWEAAYALSYELQVSNDASTWSAVYSTTTGDGGVDDITLSGPASGRYVRMLGIERATPFGYSLYEFEVYGGGGGGVPAVTVTVSPSAVAEDGTTNLVYTFTRSVVSSSALTVSFSVAGTATYNTDYSQTGAASFSATAGTITIPANQTTAQVTANPTADTTVEPDETVLLTVVAGTGYTVGTPAAATGTIQNDDGAAVTVTVAVAPLTVADDGTTNLVYTFTRSVVSSSALTVNFSVAGTATYSTDYTQTGAASFSATAGTIIIPANQTTAQVTADPAADTTVEPDETVLLTVVAGTGYTVGTPAAATGTIQNDDGQVNLALGKTAVALSIEDSTLPASNATDGSLYTRWSSLPRSDPQWIYVDLGSIATINRIILRWEVAYALSYELQVSNDASTWSAVYSTTTGDGGVDDITLSGPATGRYVRMYGTERATGFGYSLYEFEIYGGDGGAVPAVTVAVSPSAVAENGAANLVYTFTRSVVSSSALTVNFSVAGTATYSTDYTQAGAASFSATAGTIIIPANQTTAQVTVDPTADPTVEPDETVLLTVVAGTGYAVGTPAAATGTIQNDDGQVNLALGKTALASTTHSKFVASNATDGSLASRWSSAYSDPQWIYVDLGSVYTINRIILRWEVAYGRSYELQVSNDASTWSTVYSTTTGDGAVDDITLSAPAIGRYVRMYGTQRATGWGYSLYEFEVYG